jgi:hypothetical protein
LICLNRSMSIMAKWRRACDQPRLKLLHTHSDGSEAR